MNPLNLSGLVAASVTPMQPDGQLNLSTVPRIVNHLVESGIQGIYIVGSTGEGMSLTDSERMDVAQSYIKASAGQLKTFVQVGHNSMQASADLAAHAQKIGADAISATPPGYFKPANEDDLVDALAPLTEAAPDIPFYYYHIPQLSGIEIDPVQFARIASDRLATFAGIKYSDAATLYNLPLLEEAAPGREFLAGSDEAFLQAISLGYRGAVGSTYNYAAPIYDEVSRAFARGDMDEARLWQARALQMIETIISTCGRAGLKAMMSVIGIECGPVRLPQKAATPEQVDLLRSQLESLGWFEWVNRDNLAAV